MSSKAFSAIICKMILSTFQISETEVGKSDGLVATSDPASGSYILFASSKSFKSVQRKTKGTLSVMIIPPAVTQMTCESTAIYTPAPAASGGTSAASGGTSAASDATTPTTPAATT